MDGGMCDARCGSASGKLVHIAAGLRVIPTVVRLLRRSLAREIRPPTASLKPLIHSPTPKSEFKLIPRRLSPMGRRLRSLYT